VFLNENLLYNPTFLKKTSFFQKSFNWFLTRTYLFSGLQTSPLNSSYNLLDKNKMFTENSVLPNSLNFFTQAGLQTLVLSNYHYVGKLNYPKILQLKTTSGGFNKGKDTFILDGLQTSFNLTDTRFLTFIFQNNTIVSKQIYYNQLPLNFYKIYVDKPLYVSLESNSLLGTKTFYPTNSLVEQTFTQDLTLYLLLLNR
jgi:hypothetical protein